jgi:hypothetical protein
MMSDEFIECDTCNAKPGSSVLCQGCLSNRIVIGQWRIRCKTAQVALELLVEAVSLCTACHDVEPYCPDGDICAAMGAARAVLKTTQRQD